MTGRSVVFFFDVDNTLLDNDAVSADLRAHLEREVGHERQQRYWAFFEELREELGYADYLGALQRYRREFPHDPHVLTVSFYLLGYPFANRLFPHSLDVIDYCRKWGRVVLLTDGDVVFQPHKVERSGLLQAVEQHVLIYIDKERELNEVERRYPADHYVMVEDKLRILTAMKEIWEDRLTTVFVRQGHYAHDLQEITQYPPADVTIERIGDLLKYAGETLLRPAAK